MRKPFLAISLAAFVCAVGWKADAWQELQSVEGRFRALTPGTMSEKVNTVKTNIGNIAYHTFVFQDESKNADNLAYIISYCDYPEGTAHSDSTNMLEEFFNATIETATNSVRGELIYSNAISLKNYPGRHWRVDYDAGAGVIKTKSYLVKNRYYSIQVITLREKSINPSTDKFMDSFHFFEAAAPSP
jgi:hypothetical protein